jgi:hypothetical protein
MGRFIASTRTASRKGSPVGRAYADQRLTLVDMVWTLIELENSSLIRIRLNH